MNLGIFSPDSKNITYLFSQDGKQFLIRNGKKVGEGYYDIYELGIKNSPDGKKIAFPAIKNKDDKVSFVIDGETYESDRAYVLIENGTENKKYKSIAPDSLKYSSDGKKLAFVAYKKDGKSVVVNNGKESKGYDRILNIFYSKDGTVLHFLAMRNMKMLFVSNGKETKEYNQIENLAFSDDGKHFIIDGVNYVDKEWREEHFIVTDFEESKMYYHVGYVGFGSNNEPIFTAITNESGGILFKDGVEYENSSSRELAFSLDFSSFALVQRKDNKKRIFKDGEKLKEYDTVDLGNLQYSPDGKRFAYKVHDYKDPRGEFIVEGGKEGKKYDDVGFILSFSPDSKKLIYVAKEDGDEFVVMNGEEGNKYDIIESLDGEDYGRIQPYVKFSPNGENMYYIGRKDGKRVIVENGVENASYDWVEEMFYSSDNELTYLARKDDEKFIVSDGVEGKKYEQKDHYRMNLEHSKDGKKYAFEATIKTEDSKTKTILVTNSGEITNYDNILDYKYLSDGKLIFVAQKNGEEFIVQENCSGDDNSSEKDFTKQLVISKKELKKTEKGKEYIRKIDLLSEKSSTEKLENILERIGNIKKKYEGKNNEEYEKVRDMLDYLEAKIGRSINYN